MRRLVIWLAAGTIVLTGVVLPLAVLRPLGRAPGPPDTSTRPSGPPERILEARGIEVGFPEGWDGRAYFISGFTRPVIHLATFALPDSDDVLATGARSLMREDDVIIALTERSAICPCPGYDPTAFPLSLEPKDFATPFAVWQHLPPQDGDIPDAHALARRTFVREFESETGHEEPFRAFDLWVEFGTNPAPPGLVAEVNDLLAAVVIGPHEWPPQPDGLCDEWGPPKDPDCPQNIWLKGVLSEAGFQAVDDPLEQTLVGRGSGASFFIWTREPEVPLDEYDFSVRSVVDGVPVYGGGGPDGTLVWTAQGLDVRISPGPDGRDVVPDEKGIEALVRATMRVPYTPTE